MSQASIADAEARHAGGDLGGAESLCRQILALDPSNAEALNLLGLIAHECGNAPAAAELMSRSLLFCPASSVFHERDGEVLYSLGRGEEAMAAQQRAIDLDPSNAAAWNALGICAAGCGHHDLAVHAWQQTIQLLPDDYRIYSNLGAGLQAAGRLDEAIECLERTIQLCPDMAPAYSNLIAAYKYHPHTTPQLLMQQHLRFARRLAEPLRSSVRPHENAPFPERRLRIGYLSPDFRQHSVMYFLEPILHHHDASQVEVYCYSNSSMADEFTDHARACAQQFRSIVGKDDDRAAELIRSDGIDILIDLAGHTAGGRLLLFARRPAPVQVSYLGYPCTTGLTAIDYRITDAHADPPGMTEAFHVEKLVRLPESFLCYQPPAAPDVSPLPADFAGHITFGSFNDLPKMNEDVVAAWSEILKAVPRSLLVVKASALSDTGTVSRITELYARHGVAAGRLKLMSQVRSHAEHLAWYGQIDIALDTFPYNGTTTSCEAMWMGVPVVSLAGASHMSRVGVSLLETVGLPELIAADVGQYVRLAVQLASDRGKLRTLRSQLCADGLLAADGWSGIHEEP